MSDFKITSDKNSICVDFGKNVYFIENTTASTELLHKLNSIITASEAARVKLENRVAKISEENSKLNDAKEFLIKYYNPQDTRFKGMIDTFIMLDDEKKNKLIKLAETLKELNL